MLLDDRCRRALDADRGRRSTRRRARGGIAGLVIASPANPTGTMLEPARLAEIAAACRRNGIWLVSDEIYHGLTYGMPSETALAHSDEAVVDQQLLEVFLDDRLARRLAGGAARRWCGRIERLAQNLYISPPAVAQVAALGAFDGIEELEANKRVYAENRALLLERAAQGRPRRASLPADGAFYLYVDVGDFTADSVALHQGDAGRHRRRRHARRRLRCRARQPLRALLLRRHHGRHGEAARAPRGLEPPQAARA